MASAYLTYRREELWRTGLVTVYRLRAPDGSCYTLRLLASDAPRDAFLHETRSLRDLHHLHLVPLIDAGETEGRLYQVHPGVDGNLEQRLASGGPLTVGEALAITRQIGDTLCCLHRQGLVHCSLTARAVWFIEGQPFLSHLELLSAVGVVLAAPRGVPAYMSPEQARRDALVDVRWDVWALGALLYEMIEGALAWRGPHLPPTPTADRLPPALARAMRRAVAELPDDRFSTMDLFLKALAAA